MSENKDFCCVTGYEFMVEIGSNGHNKEEAKEYLKKYLSEVPAFFTDTATKSYIERRMKESGERMSANIQSAKLYEYYKGQFLAFREILEPEHYGRKEAEKIET